MRRAGIFVLSIVLVLTGCTADPQTSAPPGGTTAPTTQATTGAADPSATVPAPGQPADQAALVGFIQAGAPVDNALYTDVGGGTAFTTPSGNIRCHALRGTGVCVTGDAGGWPPAAAQPCADGWVWSDRHLSLSADGIARGECLIDPDYLGGTMAVLPYGSAVFHAEVGCRSEPAFLACARLDTGDGFIVAPGFYRIYGRALPPHGNG